MDDFVLRLMQNAVVRSLRWALQHPKAGLVTRCDGGGSSVESIDGVACLMYRESIKTYSNLEAKIDLLIDTCHRYGQKVQEVRKRIGQKNRESSDGITKLPLSMSVALGCSSARYASTRYKDGIIPVYSLTDMLGEEKMGELLKDTPFEDARTIVVTGGSLTTNAQLALLRLQGYLN